MSLSAVVITANEEANIEACLKSLSFCAEIIVVDSGSTDRTIEIARKYTDRIEVVPWKGYVEQKKYATALAMNPWVLSLDADERVSPALQKEIKEVLSSNREEAAFEVARRTYHSGRWIRHGGWYPARIIRLFDRTKGEWVGGAVHEKWEPNGKVGTLAEDLEHFSFQSLSDQVKRNDNYSTLGAVDLKNNGTKFSWLKLLTKPMTKFFETYFLKRGLMDGFPGFFISISASYSVFLKWAKLWELEKNEPC